MLKPYTLSITGILCLVLGLLVVSGHRGRPHDHDSDEGSRYRLEPADDETFDSYLSMPENRLLKRRIQLGTTDARGNGSAVVSWEASIGGSFELGVAFPTNGWLAIGFPLRDDVVGSDVLFAYYDAGSKRVVVQDRYVVNRSSENTLEMSVDTKQDWTVLHASVNATHMFVRVMRERNTKDDMDRIIWDRPANVFYAYGFTPVGPSDMTLKYDGFGWTVVNLYDTIPPPNFQAIINQAKLATNILIHGRDKTGDRRLVLGYSSDKTHVTISLLFPTRGWMAVGLSPDGRMEDSDIVFLYTNESNGKIEIQDRFISANRTAKKIDLLIDQQQDWVLDFSRYNDTHTFARVNRKLDTGDKWDRVIKDENTFVIYSYGLKSLLTPDAYAGRHDYRGVSEINLLQPGQSSWFEEEIIKDNRPHDDPLIGIILRLREPGFGPPPPMKKEAMLPNTLEVEPNDKRGPQRLWIKWGSNETHVEVGLAYPTTGWIAFGLSPDGGMHQSDVLFAYVNETTNQTVIQDRFLTFNTAEKRMDFDVDDQQDWVLVHSMKNATHTMIRAARALYTGDKRDRPITSETVPIIYSYGYKTPQFMGAPIGRHDVRGRVDINLHQTLKPTVTEAEPTSMRMRPSQTQEGLKNSMTTQSSGMVPCELPNSIMLSPEDSRGTKWLEIQWGSNGTHVEVCLCFPTLGWIAMGLSPNGGMHKSDVLFAYVDDVSGEVVLQDRYLTDNPDTFEVALTLDQQQDWQLFHGGKNGSHTMVWAGRKIKTCDSKDRSFLDQKQSVIYSYAFNAPLSKDARIMKHDVNGGTSINFLRPKSMMKNMFGEANLFINLTMPNVQIKGAEDTEYLCAMTDIPPLTKKYHQIGTKILINKANSKHIHHMLVFICADLPEKYFTKDAIPCGPKDDAFIMRECQQLVQAWANGAPTVQYPPDEVGRPFTPEMSGKKMVIQMHYDNPTFSKFTDDSGVQFILTDKIRKFDQGTLMAGSLDLNLMFTIPPGQEEFQIQGHCSSQCSTNTVPPEGITIFASALHMHTRGRSAVARHFRGDQEILPPIVYDDVYNFQYQHQKPVASRKFLPGDRIVVQCNYSTVVEKKPITGGEGTSEEMCLVFLEYYPMSKLLVCGSQFKMPEYLKTIGLRATSMVVPSRQPSTDMQMTSMAGGKMDPKAFARHHTMMKNFIQSISGPAKAYLNNMNWTSAQLESLKTFYSSDKYMGFCKTVDGPMMISRDDLPDITPFVPPNDNCV